MPQEGPYGYSEAAQPYDDAAAQWAGTLQESALLIQAAEYADHAKTCGFTGLVMLQGMLSALSNGWSGECLASFHPTYFGMMVATFHRSQSSNLHAEL